MYNDLPFYAGTKNVNAVKFTSQDVGYEYYIDNIRICSAKDKTVIEHIEDTRPNNSYPAEMLAFSDAEKGKPAPCGRKTSGGYKQRCFKRFVRIKRCRRLLPFRQRKV
ncbi:MAG: hypothetical protein L6V93_21880 [Clostridiales bacterium]|nr:MAG: hypothetical protein L6V93_21880 [Clostridiales bacterium]